MMDKKNCRISDKIGKMLVEQMAHELYNHSLYLTMANYFSVDSIVDLENYYRKRAHEEYNHFMWIYDYLCEADYIFKLPVVDKVKEDCDDIVKIFTDTINKEIETSDLIDAIYFETIEEKDTHTKIWLESKLIPEQHEEETTSRTAFDIIILDDVPLLDKAKAIYDLLK